MRFLILLMLISCNKYNIDNKKVVREQEISKSLFKLTCEDVGHWMRRCENKEAICYLRYDGKNSQCTFKGVKK